MGSTAALVLRVMPMRPSRLLDRFSSDPMWEQITTSGMDPSALAEFSRLAGSGPHPGRVIYLDVVPFGVEHPQVKRLDATRAHRGCVRSIVCSNETHSPDDQTPLHRWALLRELVTFGRFCWLAMRMPGLPVACATGSRANGASLRST